MTMVVVVVGDASDDGYIDREIELSHMLLMCTDAL